MLIEYPTKLLFFYLHNCKQEKSFRDFLLMGVVEKDKKYQWKFNVDAIADNLDKLVAFPDLGKTFEGETIFIGGENSNHIG